MRKAGDQRFRVGEALREQSAGVFTKNEAGGVYPADLKDVAGAVGCGFETSFILPNGERVTD